MDLLGGGILFLFSNESVQDSDGGHKEWHIYLQARWFDKDSHSELLQLTGWGFYGDFASLYIVAASCCTIQMTSTTTGQ